MEKLNWLDFKTNTNPILDSYRNLRANLQKLTEGRSGIVLEVTSAVTNADQSTVIAGLAIVLAQGGGKVLIIDGNLTAPAQHILFNVPNQGLTDAISAGEMLENYVQCCMEQDNLFVLPVGTSTQNTGEFMFSATLQQFIAENRMSYDYILVEVASVSDRADAMSFAPKAEGVLLVITSGEDHLNELLEAKDRLEQAGANILGCILNKAKDNA